MKTNILTSKNMKEMAARTRRIVREDKSAELKD